MQGRIFVFGSINLDLIATAQRLPKPGETVPGDSFSTAAGGKGANQALAARRAGSDVKMCGAVGSDDFAAQALELLEADGVDLSDVKYITGSTGIAVILVERAGENVITIVPGANGTLNPSDANTMLRSLKAQDVVMCQQEVPPAAIEAALKIAKTRGATSILNIAPIIEQTAELSAMADIIVANETEFALLLDRSLEDHEVKQAAQDYATQTGQTLCVTLGGAGAILALPNALVEQPALDITPVDTVGAGDTFCGYLAAALVAGETPQDALKRASVAGSLACLKPGAQPAIPLVKDVNEMLAN